jgi:hypothetical protein
MAIKVHGFHFFTMGVEYEEEDEGAEGGDQQHSIIAPHPHIYDARDLGYPCH